MPLEIGSTFSMARAQVIYHDTYGGTKTCVAKGTWVTVKAMSSSEVSLHFEGGLYETAKDGCYALAMARRHTDNDGWQWDDKKDVWKSPVDGTHLEMRVRPSVALRLFRNAS